MTGAAYSTFPEAAPSVSRQLRLGRRIYTTSGRVWAPAVGIVSLLVSQSNR